MVIFDIVLYQGRRYVLRGVTPMGLPRREAELEDKKTGERMMVPLDQIEPLAKGHDPN